MNYTTTVDAKSFSQALDQVSGVLKRSSIPALCEVQVRLTGDRCILTATDIDTWLIKEIPAQGDDFSFVLCRTKEVTKACRLFDGLLTLELDTSDKKYPSLCLRCGNRAGEFGAMDSECYPDWMPMEAKSVYTLSASALLHRVERVSYATRKPGAETRAVTRCIQCQGHHVYALDGDRLACDTDESFAFPTPFLATPEALSHLTLFGGSEVELRLGLTRAQFTDGITTLEFRRPDAVFYNLDNAIPKQFAEEFTISPKDFLRELKYLKEFAAGERTPYVRFCGGVLVMPTNHGKYSTRVDITGESDTTLAFDLHKMMDALRQFKEEPSVTVKLGGSKTPFVLEAEGRSDFALVCPVKLTDKLMAA